MIQHLSYNPRHSRHLLPGSLQCVGILAALAMLLAGCGEPETIPPGPPEVAVMTVESKDTPVTFELVGVMSSSQQVEVRAQVDGFLDDRLYTEGDIVKQGQVMFKMDARPFQA